MSNTYESTASELATKFSEQIAGKVILLTGCSPGSLAASVAQTLSSHNPALLIIASRTRSALKETENIILAASPNVKIKLLILDLASHKSVREAAAEINNSPEKIDVLINSAGIMACPFEKTVDGIESQFAVNHLGHFLFTNLIIDKFSRGGRVLNATSGGYQWTGVRYDDVNFEVVFLFSKSTETRSTLTVDSRNNHMTDSKPTDKPRQPISSSHRESLTDLDLEGSSLTVSLLVVVCNPAR